MNSKEIEKAIETLEAQNANGQFDQVIDGLKKQLSDEEPVEILMREWGLTRDEYDEVCNSFQWVKEGNNPFGTDFELKNDNQLKFLAHLIKEYKDYYVDDYDDERLEHPLDYDDLYDAILNDVETYFDIDEKISDEFSVVDEEDIYDILKANQEENAA